MQGISVKTLIAAPPEVVFSRATDLAKWPESISAIRRVELLTPGPVGVGTRFIETRIVFKREASETMEVTAFEPPRRFALGATNHGCRYESELRFAPSPGGTEVEMTFAAQPLTWMAKIMSFLFRPMFKMMAKSCQKDLHDLKAAIEGTSAAAAPGGHAH